MVDRWIGHERKILRWLGYGVFLAAFVPLIFGGKIYNTIEMLMAAKTILVLGYLTFLAVFYVDWQVWAEVFSGFFKFGALPLVDGQQVTWWDMLKGTFGVGGQGAPLDVALLAVFAAIAGAGGLGNATFSNYVRDKGWGMGARVGAIASAVGGTAVKLSHRGKVFTVTTESMQRWRGWRKVTIRDQLGVWVVGCILGMGIPALVSLQFVAGRKVHGDSLAALTAQGVVDATGAPIFWFLTLLCGFMVLGPAQVTTVDSFCRRWTDVIWTASPQVRHLGDDKVKYIYYALMTIYAFWGVMVLTLIPDPLLIVKLAAVPLNFALGLSAIHTLVVNCVFLPEPLRPGWFMRLSMVACALFFVGIAVIATTSLLRELAVAAAN